MNTLYLTRGCRGIIINTEDNTCNNFEESREAVNYVYAVKEPMHVVYGCGEYHKEFDVKKGDIIVAFYHGTFENDVIVAKSKDWFNNILAYEKKEQEEKEKWALQKAEAVPCCGDCDNCECKGC